jgi:hypothetical protein
MNIALKKPLNCIFVTRIAMLALLVLLCPGCGGPKRIPVTGSITVDGKPAVGATLLFHPVEASQTSIGSGNADADGKFSIVSDAEKGLVAGSYIVTVTWPDPAVQPTAAQKMTGMFDVGPDLLKGRFETKEKSSLKADITNTTKELPPFVLKSK